MEGNKSYVVTNPSVQGVVALVNAPSTEKARTTYLDFLERSQGLDRNLRSQLRTSTLTKRIEDGSGINFTVELDYGYRNPEPVVQLGAEGVPLEEGIVEPMESQVMSEQVVTRPRSSMPIADVAFSDPIVRIGGSVA